MDTLQINSERLWRRIDELAQVGAIADTNGCSRLALTDEDREGRNLVITWMEDLGMEIAIDGVGNVVGTWFGNSTDKSLPLVMTGSHIDTVRTGGRFDGNLGVLAGLEVVETLAENGISPLHPIAVGFFTGEEGARFAPDMLGSLVYVGGMSLESTLDIEGIDGKRLGDELERIGFRGAAPCPGPIPKAFIELHVEQGPILEADATSIGAVDSVQGISWTEITIEGQSNHAGTTPMHMRHDAGFAAAQIATFVRQIALETGGNQVGTVGKIDLHPNLVNVVASKAVITVDLRNTDDEVLQHAESQLHEFCKALSERENVEITSKILARFEPVTFAQELVAEVTKAAESLGLSVQQMTSGAGHDAQMFARVCPTAMIFVPSEGGLSHNPAEFTSQEQIKDGANVLLQVLIQLAEEQNE
ncbi:MAG TPA: Zn-dependent hydrolase [Acidimicrobiales bacterium]|nr:Zn-dependent hydrolase [Acidimicrobiales bacterium]